MRRCRGSTIISVRGRSKTGACPPARSEMPEPTMQTLDHVIVLGEEHTSASRLHVAQALRGAAAYGISVGYTDKANEDALGIASIGPDALVAVADGHWGSDASK